MAVSYRQAKRLYGRYRAEGAKGLKHRSAGRRSNAARQTPEREQILGIVREKYSGTVDERFGPTLAAEHLASGTTHLAGYHDDLPEDESGYVSAASSRRQAASGLAGVRYCRLAKQP
jgi:hypothetical protein